MRAVRWILPTLIWMLSVATAQADFITYTESATATGALGSSSFTDALVTLTVVGNPFTPGLCTGVPNCTVNAGVISVDVSGVGTATLTDAHQGVIRADGALPAGGMADFTANRPVIYTESPVFATYNITESIGPITGTAFSDRGVVFPTSAGSFVLNSVVGNSTFTALSTLTRTGGTFTNPATFTQSGVGQISSTIGGLGSEASYEFAWLGGAFDATASVAGANPTGSYLFQLSEPGSPGTIIDDETLDGTNSFSATINDILLAPGDYVIGLLANSLNDPTFTIDFTTPVNGTAGAATVAEPPSLTLLASGLILIFFFGNRRHKSPLDFPS
jgi:hypothetical protein